MTNLSFFQISPELPKIWPMKRKRSNSADVDGETFPLRFDTIQFARYLNMHKDEPKLEPFAHDYMKKYFKVFLDQKGQGLQIVEYIYKNLNGKMIPVDHQLLCHKRNETKVGPR